MSSMTDRQTLLPDARVTLVFGSFTDIGAGDAALVEGDGAAAGAMVIMRFQATEPSRAPACLCCQPRTGAAGALSALFLARARGAWFRRVVVVAQSEPGRREVERALAEDVLAAARFRLDETVAPDPAHRPVPAGAA